ERPVTTGKPVSNPGGDAGAAYELHDHKIAAKPLQHVVERSDAGMRKSRGGTRLPQEPVVKPLLPFRVRRGDAHRLDGDFSLQQRITRAIYHAHAALPQLLLDPVAANPLA